MSILQRLKEHSAFAQWLMLALALSIVGSVVGLDLYFERNTVDSNEREQLAAHAGAIAQNLAQQLRTTSRALDSIRGDLPFLMAQREGKALLKRRLQATIDAMPGVRTLMILDAQGTVRHGNREELIGQNFREREYFRSTRQNHDPASLHIAPPFKTVLGVFSVTVAKAMVDERGEFAGIVLATIDPEYFNTLLSSVLYAPDMRSTVMHGDGKLIARVPDPDGAIGVDVAARPGAFFVEHIKSGRATGIFAGATALTGEVRLTAFRTLQPAAVSMDRPLVIATSRMLSAIFAEWRRVVYVQCALFVLLVLISSMGLYYFQKRQRAYARIEAMQEAEREQARAALQNSEARYRRFAEELPLGMVITQDELVKYVNRTTAEWIGYAEDEILGKPFLSFVCESDRPWLLDLHRRRMKGEEVDSTYVIGMVRKDGEVRQWQFKTSTIEWGGKLSGYGIITDVTESKRAEALLRTRLRITELAQAASLDELLQAALDGAEEVTASKIGFFHLVDADQENLTLQAWSTNTLKHICTAEGKGQHYAISAAGVWVDAFHKRAPVIHNDYASLAHKKGMPEGHAQVTRELVVPILRAGKVTEIMGVGNKVTDYVHADVEAVEMIAAMVQDLVDRRRAEEALRSERALLQQITLSSPVGIAVVHRTGRITLANSAAEKILGLKRSELLQHDYDAPLWKHTDLAGNPFPLDQLPVARVLATGEAVFEVENGIEWPDGRRVLLSINAAPLFDASGALDGVVATILDITERKRLEEARLQAHKLEALGTLAGGVAHDFNNIIAAILGNVELARQDVDPKHPAQVSLEEIHKASRRAKDLVQQILAFGRRSLVQRSVISLVPAVQEAARLLRATLPAGVQLDIECAPDAPQALADATQIGQVVINLGSNAWQAIQGQSRPGKIEIRLQAYERAADLAQDEGFVLISGELRPGRYARLSVQDNGSGIDGKTLPHLFEPFFTTKPVDKGTGLGLAVVHGIAQQHDAGVEVRSVPGAGSTFRVYFPAAQAAEPAVGAKMPDVSAKPSPGRSVLYIDDDEAIVFLMTRMLERQGYRVSGYTDPLQALAAVRDDAAQFDLAVTDYNMPGMSGLEVAHALKEIRTDLPVALASGYINEELEQKAPAAGVSELIYKPDTVEGLCEAVARLAQTAGRKSKSS